MAINFSTLPKNPCVKTGANVYLTSHDGYLHGDMFFVAGVYYFRFVGDVQYGKMFLECDFRIDNEDAPETEVFMLEKTIVANPKFVVNIINGVAR